MSPGHRRGLLVVLALIPAVAVAQPRSRTVALTDVSVVGGTQAVEVRLKLSGRAVPKTMLLEQPWRLVLDFHGVEFRWRRTPISVGGNLIREVRGSQYENGAARVVIQLTRSASWVVDRTPDGLRVTLSETGRPAPPSKAGAPRPPAVGRTHGGLEVQGIIVRDDVPVAYIRDPATKQVKSYRVGDRVGDAVIEKIGEREVVFTTPTGPVEVRLEAPGK
ncbi:MAG: AMIN domain-containing protein [Candidatus Rokuibacteriota bacterium]